MSTKKIITVTPPAIKQAQKVLRQILEPTPLLYNGWLSENYGCHVFLKLENMQPIGSFKIRGAAYKISKLTAQQRKKGVVAASAGNHAQGVAWAALVFNTHATIVMPTTAPLTKIQQTRALRAGVILEGTNYDEAYLAAQKLVLKTGKTFIHPYEDSDIIAGQGTIGLELFEQLSELDVVIGSMGGGGMMAGVGTSLKALCPNSKIIGAQAEGACSLAKSIKTGKAISTGFANTFADGIKVIRTSQKMVGILKPVIDSTATAKDEAIATAILTLMEKAKILAEGAGALPLAVLHSIQKQVRKKKVVLIISGGNIDVNVLARIIDRGLIESGRRVRLNVWIKDRPGSLNRLTDLLAQFGANVLQVIHDRDMPQAGLDETGVELTLETRGESHSRDIVRALKNQVVRLELLH